VHKRYLEKSSAASGAAGGCLPFVSWNQPFLKGFSLTLMVSLVGPIGRVSHFGWFPQQVAKPVNISPGIFEPISTPQNAKNFRLFVSHDSPRTISNKEACAESRRSGAS